MRRRPSLGLLMFGELPEWTIGAVLKTADPSGVRGFESHTPRSFASNLLNSCFEELLKVSHQPSPLSRWKLI